MMDAEIKPYLGVGPIQFGMPELEVRRILGEPLRSRRMRNGELELMYAAIIVRLSIEPHLVVEISLLPASRARIGEIDIFLNDFWLELARRDSDPQEVMGFIVLRDFGTALSDFQDSDVAQRAVTVFAKGRLNRLTPRMKPWKKPSGRTED